MDPVFNESNTASQVDDEVLILLFLIVTVVTAEKSFRFKRSGKDERSSNTQEKTKLQKHLRTLISPSPPPDLSAAEQRGILLN